MCKSNFFLFRGDPERFLDPSSIVLVTQIQFTKADDTAVTGNCAPVANLAGSMWSRVIVMLGNSTQITSSNDLYPYLSYLEVVLKGSQEFKRQQNYMQFIWEVNKFSFSLFSIKIRCFSVLLGYPQIF